MASDDIDAELQRLQQQINERDDMLAMAAHELRNQMHTLTLQLKLAQLAAEAKDSATTAERVIKAQATLARYIDRVTLLLDLTRLNAKTYPLALRDIDLSEVLRQIAESVLPEAQFRNVALTLSLPPACPARSDPAVLEHIVGNLLLNAFKHAACATVTLTLEALDGERAQIKVSDDGRGIAAADQQRIFAKFVGAAGDLGRGSGTGLGLWIVSKLVDALGGSITLDSRPDAGCTFTLSLPLRREGHAP